MKRHFPTVIIYISRKKEKLIESIINADYSTEEKTLRILSIDAEKRNKEICDYVIDNNVLVTESVDKIKSLIWVKNKS